MADKIVLADTSVLIDLFRKTDKSKAALVALVRKGYVYCISAVTEYEISTGATLSQVVFWEDFLHKTDVLPFDKNAPKAAVSLTKELKRKRKLIDVPDLFIAATAIVHNLPIATLNKKHFERIDGLQIIE